MAAKRAGNSKFLKEYNESVVLDLIRTNKAISKAELSSITGLSATAMGVITASLIGKGYIHEMGTGESKGGRRPIMLELKPDSFYSAGIDMDTDYIKAVLMDITGKVVNNKCIDMLVPPSFDLVIKKAEKLVVKMLEEQSLDFSKLLGIGFSVPGMVDSLTHKIVLAPNLEWENADIRQSLTILGDIPSYVENESMSSAICENWIGLCSNVGNFVCINIKSGIGAGIFTGGKLYRGTGGTAGEVGHISVDENGPKCGCGNYGCLETVASSRSIVERARRLIKQGVVSSLNRFDDVEEIDLDAVIDASRSGDEAARNILNEAARYIGIAVTNLVNTLNPSKIVLGKEFVKYADLVIDIIKGVVECKALKDPAERVEVVASEIGESASALGAAIIPLKVLFKYTL
ncbi:MAG: ROK family protein [Bacillota bacterium]|nr:ROK family protein [Bacillota bacterium]